MGRHASPPSTDEVTPSGEAFWPADLVEIALPPRDTTPVSADDPVGRDAAPAAPGTVPVRDASVTSTAAAVPAPSAPTAPPGAHATGVSPPSDVVPATEGAVSGSAAPAPPSGPVASAVLPTPSTASAPFPADAEPPPPGRTGRLVHGLGEQPLALVGVVILLVGVSALLGATLFGGSGDGTAEPSAGGSAETARPATTNPAIYEAPTIPTPDTVAPIQIPERAADLAPTAVRIPGIEVDAPVDALGVDAQNALQVPTDPARVGWWSGGAKPGEDDPSVLVGHLDSSTGPAVFFQLERLVPGDVIEVDRADGSTAQFMIERLESHPKTQFPTTAVYGSTEGSTLRLITCFGAFDDVARSYENNLVVYANLMP